jgi:hypothetical protein
MNELPRDLTVQNMSTKNIDSPQVLIASTLGLHFGWSRMNYRNGEQNGTSNGKPKFIITGWCHSPDPLPARLRLVQSFGLGHKKSHLIAAHFFLLRDPAPFLGGPLPLRFIILSFHFRYSSCSVSHPGNILNYIEYNAES